MTTFIQIMKVHFGSKCNQNFNQRINYCRGLQELLKNLIWDKHEFDKGDVKIVQQIFLWNSSQTFVRRLQRNLSALLAKVVVLMAQYRCGLVSLLPAFCSLLALATNHMQKGLTNAWQCWSIILWANWPTCKACFWTDETYNIF